MNQSSRTEEWLRQAVRGKTTDIVQKLRHEHVAIVLGENVQREPQAQLVFTFAVNLAARLSPIVQRLTVVVAPDVQLVATIPRWRERLLAAHVHTFLTRLSAPVEWQISAVVPTNATIVLSVGSCSPDARDRSIFVGSRGWSAFFSPVESETVGGAPNPIGAYAAACIGVAELWKRLLDPHRSDFVGVPIVPRCGRLVFSTLTYLQEEDDGDALPAQIDLGALTLAGAGAGGGAAAFALASIPAISMDLKPIDPDAVEPPNLNRYVFADGDDATFVRSKVSLVEELFANHANVRVEPFAEPFSSATRRLQASALRYVLAAVHSREARRDVQYETPQVLWDCGAAQHGEFRIWRMILGETECMFCKHPLSDEDPERMKALQMHGLLGLPVSDLIRKIKDHEPFTSADISTIEAHVPATGSAFSLPVKDQRFNDWETAQCGKISLPEIEGEVPIPFAPVMAGVLIAGEILKETIAPQHVLRGSYENTLLGSFSRHRKPELRRTRTDCTFCHDEMNLAQYRRRWLRH
jgi:hypothetical protein